MNVIDVRNSSIKTYVTKIIANKAIINYKFEGGNDARKDTNNALVVILSYLPPVVSNYSIDICKNSSMSGSIDVINYDKDVLFQYLVNEYPKKGYVKIDLNTGIWKYTSKVGEIGVDNFIVKVKSSSGTSTFSKITINILDILCCKI